MSRRSLTQSFLFLSVLSWGIGAGAKLFDLLVLATAWGRSPKSSLALYPYGRQWPINPGDFFQPLSALILIGSLGALIGGWKTRRTYKVWLWIPVVAFVIIWILTPTIFWPIIIDLYAVASRKVVRSDTDVAQLVQRWMLLDWTRVALIGIGFMTSMRALSLRFAPED